MIENVERQWTGERVIGILLAHARTLDSDQLKRMKTGYFLEIKHFFPLMKYILKQ